MKMKKVDMYNYLPKTAEGAYLKAILGMYHTNSRDGERRRNYGL